MSEWALTYDPSVFFTRPVFSTLSISPQRAKHYDIRRIHYSVSLSAELKENTKFTICTDVSKVQLLCVLL